MTLNPARIKAIRQHGSYFSEEQVRILSELGAYLKRYDAIPNAEQLAESCGRDPMAVRNDLNKVTLEGFLWVYGAEQ